MRLLLYHLNPKLSIDTQPVDRIVAVGVAATFGVDASLTDGSAEGFSYHGKSTTLMFLMEN